MKTQHIIADRLQEVSDNSEYSLFPVRLIHAAQGLPQAIEVLEAYREAINHAIGFLRAEIRKLKHDL